MNPLPKSTSAQNLSQNFPQDLPQSLGAFNRSSLTLASSTLLNILEQFQGMNVAIVGDLMLDAYTDGNVTRISPEAPVPILQYKGTHYRLGGAGNVLMNLKRLGLKPHIFSVIGSDNEGAIIKELLAKENIETRGIITDSGRHTTLKTRIVSQNHQLLRIDREELSPISSRIAQEFIEKLQPLAKNLKGILFSDYAKGLFHAETFKPLVEWARTHNLYTALDPKSPHLAPHLAPHSSFYRDLSIMTPNFKEAMTSTSAVTPNSSTPLAHRFEYSLESFNHLYQLGQSLIERHSLERLIITLGEHGMALFDKDSTFHLLPTFCRTVNDVSGAGDTVIAVYLASYLASRHFLQSAILANLAAGFVVSEFTTFAISKEHLESEIRNRSPNDTLSLHAYSTQERQ